MSLYYIVTHKFSTSGYVLVMVDIICFPSTKSHSEKFWVHLHGRVQVHTIFLLMAQKPAFLSTMETDSQKHLHDNHSHMPKLNIYCIN